MKFCKPIGSWKPIRHPSWTFFAPVNSSARSVPPTPSTSRLQLLCQCFPSMLCDDRTNNVATGMMSCTSRYPSTTATGEWVDPNNLIRAQGMSGTITTQSLQERCNHWYMILNPNKTKALVVSWSRTVSTPHRDLVLSAVSIGDNHYLDILGLKFDSKLIFEDHVRFIVSGVS